MVLSAEGWLNGITATACILFAFTCGLSIIFQAKKIKAKLLFFMGLNIFFTGFYWLIPSVDFFSILLKGQNIVSDKIIWAGILTSMWTPFIILISFYIGSELLVSKNKRYIISIVAVLCIIFESLLFMDPNSAVAIQYPEINGNDLIVVGIIIPSLAFILYIIFIILGIIYCGFGYLIKSTTSSGILKTKFLLLTSGYLLFLLFPLFISIMNHIFINNNFSDISMYFTRIGMVGSFPLFYLGLQEQSEVPVPTKDIRITEEEITLLKEKNICLVCKNKILGFNSYLCECGVLYCEKCARSLINSENACWICNSAIDKRKAVKISPSIKDNRIKIMEGLFRVKKQSEKLDEVRSSKEKKKCLVCKGNVLGFNIFICNCGAMYCKKCAHALINLENTCWSCNISINKSEPVKLIEDSYEKDDDIKITS